MGNAFILRFQEQCDSKDATNAVAGTATMTRVEAEQPDSDPVRSALLAGTATVTKVATEQKDTDRANGPAALPRAPIEMGTKTATAVRAEASDDDPGQQHHQTLRR